MRIASGRHYLAGFLKRPGEKSGVIVRLAKDRTMIRKLLIFLYLTVS